MPSSKELNIIIQAQLESGNTIENAKNLGQGIANAIESAFEGLGERIAASLILKMQGVLNNVRFTDVLSNNSNATAQLQQTAQINSLISQPMVEHPSGLMVPLGAGSRLAENPGGSVVGGAAAPKILDQHGNVAPTQGQFHKNDVISSLDRFSYGNFGLGYMNRAFMGISGDLSRDFSYAKVAALDTTHEEMRRVLTMKKIDPNYKVEEDLVTSFRSHGKQAAEQVKIDSEEWKRLNSKIPELTSSLENLKKSILDYDKLTKEQKAGRQDFNDQEKELLRNGPAGLGSDPEKRQKEIEKLDAEIAAARSRQSAIKSTAGSTSDYLADLERNFPEDRSPKSAWSAFKQMGIGQRLSLAGVLGSTAFDTLAEYHDYFPRQDAAKAQLDNMTGRALLTGDLSQAFTIDALGGKDKIIEEANKKANYQADQMMMGGLGVVGGSLTAAGMIAGGTIGVGTPVALGVAGAGTLAGGGMIAKGAFDRFFNYQLVEQAAKEQIATAQKTLDVGLITGQMAMGRSINSFDTAQSIGDVNLTREIYGASMNPYDLNSGERSHRYRSTNEFGLSGRQFDAFNLKMQTTMGGRGAMRDDRTYSPFSESMRLLGMGAYNIADVASTVFNDQARTSRTDVQTGTVTKEKYVQLPNKPDLSFIDANQSSVGSSPSMSGMGNVAKVSYQEPVYTSQVDPGKYAAASIERTNDLYESVFAAGVDRKDVAGVIGFAANRAAAAGSGAFDSEQKEMMDSLRITRQVFGSDDMNSRNLQMVQGFNAALSDRARGSDGLAVTAGVKKLGMLQKEFSGLGLKNEDEFVFRNFKMDANSIQKYFKDSGRDISKDDAERLMKRERDLTAVSMNKSLSYLPESMRMDIIAKEMGANTLEERNTISDSIKAQEAYNKMTPDERRKADIPDSIAIPSAMSAEKDQKVVARYGAEPDKMAQQAKDAKKATEAGETEAVTKGFDALTATTNQLNISLGSLKATIEGLGKLTVGDKTPFAGEWGNFFSSIGVLAPGINPAMGPQANKPAGPATPKNK